MKTLKVPLLLPLRYLPTQLTRRDKAVQLKMLLRSRALYKKTSITRAGPFRLIMIKNRAICWMRAECMALRP